MSDPVNQRVEQFLKSNPRFRNNIRQLGEGEYLIDGRECKVGFCRQGFLVVHDGPLRQPFTDYVQKSDTNVVYHQQGLKASNINNLDEAKRISFGDEGYGYTRLDAMKVAKEQAAFRQKAANCVVEGQSVPGDLKEKYQKAIDTKLGRRRCRPNAGGAESASPAWWPGASSPQAAAAQPSHAPPQPQQNAPVACVAPASHMPAMVGQTTMQAAPLALPNMLSPTVAASPNIAGSYRMPRQSMAPAPVVGAPQTRFAASVSMSAPAVRGSMAFQGGVMKAPVAGYPSTPMITGRFAGA